MHLYFLNSSAVAVLCEAQSACRIIFFLNYGRCMYFHRPQKYWNCEIATCNTTKEHHYDHIADSQPRAQWPAGLILRYGVKVKRETLL